MQRMQAARLLGMPRAHDCDVNQQRAQRHHLHLALKLLAPGDELARKRQQMCKHHASTEAGVTEQLAYWMQASALTEWLVPQPTRSLGRVQCRGWVTYLRRGGRAHRAVLQVGRRLLHARRGAGSRPLGLVQHGAALHGRRASAPAASDHASVLAQRGALTPRLPDNQSNSTNATALRAQGQSPVAGWWRWCVRCRACTRPPAHPRRRPHPRPPPVSGHLCISADLGCHARGCAGFAARGRHTRGGPCPTWR